jgi:hypothetical protein
VTERIGAPYEMMSSRVSCSSVGIVVILFASQLPQAASAQDPWWLDSLGYTRSQLFSIRVGADGFPYVPVRIDSTELWLLFDTGNMVGLTVTTREFDRLQLPVTGTVRRRASSGELVGESRIGRAARVEALGHVAAGVAVREFEHPRLSGLFGPSDLAGDRFTLDYQLGVIAVGGSAPGVGMEQGALPLVRSARHPSLILVEGAVRGEPVVIELDTGKSRTVVDPVWAGSIGLVAGWTDTVAVGEVTVGQAVFHVRNAKPVELGAIDPDLAAPIGLSLGSDTLSRFIITVDYARGLAWLMQRAATVP